MMVLDCLPAPLPADPNIAGQAAAAERKLVLVCSCQQLAAIEGNSSMAKSSPGSVIGQKALGTLIMWSTVGLICVQVFFYVSFGPAV